MSPHRYTGSPASNLGLILYANINLVLAFLRALTHLVSGSSPPAARALVDTTTGGPSGLTTSNLQAPLYPPQVPVFPLIVLTSRNHGPHLTRGGGLPSCLLLRLDMKKDRMRWASFPDGHASDGVTVSVPSNTWIT